jgi:hypothetical protein
MRERRREVGTPTHARQEPLNARQELGVRECDVRAYVSRSKTIVAWMRSPPPKPPVPDEAVLIVCSRRRFTP